jgi:hypothetical protein
VSLRAGEVSTECNLARNEGGHQCPGRPSWNHVGPAELRVSGSSWPCVWAHPVSGHELVLDFGRQQLAKAIEVEAALSDQAATTPRGASVMFSLVLDGQKAARWILPNSSGLKKWSVRTTPKTQSVQLVITTGADARRHVGVNLRIVEPPVESHGATR